MSQIDNIIIQVRSRLQQLGIKLWLDPYYYEEIGCVEDEIEKLSNSFSQNLSISQSKCKLALTELQEGALRKLAARKEFVSSGIATLTVSRINNRQGTQKKVEVKCPLKALGSELQAIIAKSFNIVDASRIKCISAGKIIDPEKSLEVQNVKNNQQIMVIISEVEKVVGQQQEDILYDRIRKIKMDVETILDSRQQLFEMEDQDGKPIFLPPAENRAILTALSYYEKARAAIKRKCYDEALVLLLEADEKFITCDSKFLESVDNYALLNLDIVWCYLCLKNVSQLPDAQRRLDLCEEKFHRSYGENLERLIKIKGNAYAEKPLIMRLHLLQGVLLFHQNRRNEAYEKLVVAEKELEALKVDDNLVDTLVEMGYEPFEARLALRSCNGQLQQAIDFIDERIQKLEDAREKSEKERELNEKLKITATNKDEEWVNPRSVCTLVEMGYERDVVIEALKRCSNDLSQTVELLQTGANEIKKELPPAPTVSAAILKQLKQLGFEEEKARDALETTGNNLENAIECLLKPPDNEQDIGAVVNHLSQVVADFDCKGPSTSSRANRALKKKVREEADKELKSLEAYERFTEEISDDEEAYLGLSLLQEEQILAEYKRLLEQ